jgi:hypothetical protein
LNGRKALLRAIFKEFLTEDATLKVKHFNRSTLCIFWQLIEKDAFVLVSDEPHT